MKYLFVLLLAFVSFNCKNDPAPIQPSNRCDDPPGNRSFTWKLDTVAWFPSTVAGVWAFSDSDAYVMGMILDNKPPYVIRAGRHWNGTRWDDNINGTYGYGMDIALEPCNDVTGDDRYLVAVGYWAVPGTYYAGIAEFDNNLKKWKSSRLSAVGNLRSVWTDRKGFFLAAGDNGIVYTKDGYSSDWIYQKIPTGYNFYKLTGVSKNEVYALGYLSSGSGGSFEQIWKYDGRTWMKIMDNQDTTGMPIQVPEAQFRVGDIYAVRCVNTDSLRLYVIGWESNLFEAKGASLAFKKTNLTDRGLYLNALGRTAQRVFGFSENDIWIFGVRYTIYHWNGIDFLPMGILGIPDKDVSPDYRRMIKAKSGKIFFPLTISSQVYVVAQGTP